MTPTSDKVLAANGGKAFAEDPAILSIKTESLEELERSCLARTRRSLAQLSNATLQWQQDSPEEKPGALAEEQEKCKDSSDKELSQGEDISIHTIWVNASVPELFQDTHAGPQEESGRPSRLGTGVAGDIAGDLQSASPALAGPTDAEPAACALAGTPEQEGHRTPLAPMAEEEAKATASPILSEQAPAAEVESWAPAPYTPPEYKYEALQDTALLR